MVVAETLFWLAVDLLYEKSTPPGDTHLCVAESLRSTAVRSPFSVVLLAILISSAILKGHWLADTEPSLAAPPPLQNGQPNCGMSRCMHTCGGRVSCLEHVCGERKKERVSILLSPCICTIPIALFVFQCL